MNPKEKNSQETFLIAPVKQGPVILPTKEKNESIELENIMIGIVKSADCDMSQLECLPRSIDTVEIIHEKLAKYYLISEIVEKHMQKINALVERCEKYAKNLEDDINTPRSEDFVYQTKRHMLSYKSNNDKIKIKDLPFKIEQNSINISPLNYTMTLPIIKTLDELYKQHSIFYCEETKSLWIVLPGANLVKVPFPEIIDCTKSTEKSNSIRCRYQSKSICGDKKQGFWHCNYAHQGEKMVKLGYPMRCPAIPNFGNPETIRKDIQYVSLPDIKSLLMYGLNDVMIASIWMDYNGKKNQKYDNVDKG